MDETSRRTDIDGTLSREEADPSAGGQGQRIPGRDFAGTSRAADQREQTADHRGESRVHMMDDVAADAPDENSGRAPRDQS